MEELKRCSKCSQHKLLSDFYKNKSMPDGLCWWCKVCQSASNNQYRKSDAGRQNQRKRRATQQYKEWYLEYRRQTVARTMWFSARARAKQRCLPFTITLDDIVIPEFCPVLGIPIVDSTGSRRPRENSPSLDRKDPEQGYTPENVWVISMQANVMKSNADVKLLKRFARWVTENFGVD